VERLVAFAAGIITIL